MTEYKTFDDYVRNVFKLEPTELTHISPEEQKKKTVRITVDELINIWNELTELKAQIEKMKSQYDYAFNQLCESREIICLMLSQYKNKKEIDYSTKERGEKLLKQGVYKYD